MKKVIFFLLFCFSTTLSFGQLVPKEKSKPVTEEKQAVDTATSTSTSGTVICPPPSSNTVVLTPKKKEVKIKDVGRSLNNPSYIKDTDGDEEDEDNWLEKRQVFPVSQVEGFFHYVKYNDYLLNGSGVGGQFIVRQSQTKIVTRNNKTYRELKKTMWGLGVKAGRYKTMSRQLESDLNTFESTTTELGFFISVAHSKKGTTFNSWVLNIGGKRALDEGGDGFVKRKQKDLLLEASGWLDLTRKKENLFFSRINLSFHYQYPLKTTVETFYNEDRVGDFKWNKKSLSLNLDITFPQFNFSEIIDRTSLHFGTSASYYHYSQGKKDLYGAGLFTELFYMQSKVLRVGAELILDLRSETSRGELINIKAELDLIQLGKAIL